MRIKFLISLFISAIFIFLAFRGIDYKLMLAAFQDANYWWLLPSVVAMFASHWLRAVRWRYFMEPIKRVDTPTLFAATMIGYYGNNVFPLRAGEVLRAYSIGKAAGVSRMASFATIIVERLIDVFSLLLLLAISVAYHKYPNWIEKGALVIFLFTVASTIFMISLVRNTAQTLAFMDRIALPFPQRVREMVRKLLRSFLEGFGIFQKSEHFWTIAWQSLVIWLFYAATIFFTLEAFSLNDKFSLPLGASFIILVMISIGIMVPAAPGYVGTFHWICQQALVLFNVSESESLSFAVIMHISNFIPVTLAGFYYYYKQQVDFREAVAGAAGNGENTCPRVDASAGQTLQQSAAPHSSSPE
ncbi:MAG: lysylphosphatidylglycerol synthase transmembrane domain-containing protein [bacterium]